MGHAGNVRGLGRIGSEGPVAHFGPSCAVPHVGRHTGSARRHRLDEKQIRPAMLHRRRCPEDDSRVSVFGIHDDARHDAKRAELERHRVSE